MSAGYWAMAAGGALLKALALLVHAARARHRLGDGAPCRPGRRRRGISFVFTWEVLDRGISQRLRGRTFALAFGWGRDSPWSAR